jgi:uncharacterized protein
MKRIICLIILIISLFFLYANYLGIKGLNVQENTIPIENLPDSYDGFKIIQFSDLLLGSTTSIETINNVKDTINKYHPDIVIFTGDLIKKGYNLNDNDQTKLSEALNAITSNIKKIAITGDNDTDKSQDILSKSGFNIINDSSLLIFNKSDSPIEFVGINNFDNIDKTLNQDVEPIYTIALIHQPDNIKYLKDKKINLILSGHSLGGLINAPFYGPVIKKEGAKLYTYGKYAEGNQLMYVSGGIGTEKINMRAFNKPEINLYKLEKK